LLAPEDVLDFWFVKAGPKRWFAVDPAFDAMMRRRFGPICHAFRHTSDISTHPWLVEPDSALALILLLDQAPRNIWRGSNAAFALDPLALQAANSVIDAGFDWMLPLQKRAFAYLPFTHSEDLEDQAVGVWLHEERLAELSDSVRHARAHYDVIARFGRFPHRNDSLGRVSTPAERTYLDTGGYAPSAKRPAKSAQGQV